MKNIHRNKSRARLWNSARGTKEITTTAGAGRLAVGSIVFANIPVATETVTIGGYVFEAQAGASEAAGTSAGTAADPHLYQAITNLATAGASLAAQVLAETATTGAWGYMYPDDSAGVDFTTDTLTLTFWPGTAGNAVTLAGSAGDETITQPVTASLGRYAPEISQEHKYTTIDTTNSTQNQEYYVLNDGTEVGETVEAVIASAGGSDTPTLVGHFLEAGVAMVECEFITAETGAAAEFMWMGSGWEMIHFNTLHTVPDFTPAA